MDAAPVRRKYPGYTLAQLEAAMADGRGTAEIAAEIAMRKAEIRLPFRTPQVGMFRDHRCWKCQDGARPCAQGNPLNCDYPRARND